MQAESLHFGALFLEGLLSFFSPCVLPLVPVYLGYLTADISKEEYRSSWKARGQTALLTLCFVLGIWTVFLAAAAGLSALQHFFSSYHLQLTLAGGILLLIFGLMELGVIQIPFLQQEKRIAWKPGKMNALHAWLLGFFFSFAWSPCIGPVLASALTDSALAGSRMISIARMMAYAAGFTCMFLLIGLFTDEILGMLKNIGKL